MTNLEIGLITGALLVLVGFFEGITEGKPLTRLIVIIVSISALAVLGHLTGLYMPLYVWAGLVLARIAIFIVGLFIYVAYTGIGLLQRRR